MNLSWDDRQSLAHCPFEAQLAEEDGNPLWIANLEVSSLYLERNQTYAGHCVLIYQHHVTRIDGLTPDQWAALARDIYAAEGAVMRVMRPAHINVASLGNMVPHLHWHIIPRYQHDPRWGQSIWTTRDEEMGVVRLSDDEYAERVGQLRAALKQGGPAG